MKRSSQLFVLLILLVFGIPGIGQNLLQNPGFESFNSWDEFWVLSTIAPSSVSAVATEITTDSHEGLKSVELSNPVAKDWTYFYSDTANAPLSFSANKSYEVKGWIRSIEKGKSVELSILWNGGMDELILYKGNPDPITNPDWFMIKDIITPAADCVDGFLSLGFRSDKDGGLVVGKLLLDDFSVVKLPDTDTDIVDFSFPEQTGPAKIDPLLHLVNIEVLFGADLTSLIPNILISDIATIVPASGVAKDFSIPVLYTVTAEDGITLQDWTIIVTKGPPSNDIDVSSFEMTEQTGPAIIDNVLHTIILEVLNGTDLTSLIPIFGIPTGATINPESGVAQNFSSPAIFRVTAEDGVTTQNYIVALMPSPFSSETDINSFSIPEQTAPGVLDSLLHTVNIDVPFGTDVTTLVPTLEPSAGASVGPGSFDTVDFVLPVIYTVTAEDGISTQDWIVTVVVEPNIETEIVAFSVVEQTGPAIIDTALYTVFVEVPWGTDVTNLAPTIEPSAGAALVPVSGDTVDFAIPVIYAVTAEDGISNRDWTVTVVILQNTETEIVAFSVVEQTGPAIIDTDLHAVNIEVEKETNVSSLVPVFVLSEGASIDPVGGVATDFTDAMIYTVTAEDGTTSQDWHIDVAIDSAVFVVTNQTASAIYVYPNPATNMVYIKKPGKGDIYLYDVSGRVVVAIEETSTVTIIPVSDLERGIYFIHARWNNLSTVSKIILK